MNLTRSLILKIIVLLWIMTCMTILIVKSCEYKKQINNQTIETVKSIVENLTKEEIFNDDKPVKEPPVKESVVNIEETFEKIEEIKDIGVEINKNNDKKTDKEYEDKNDKESIKPIESTKPNEEIESIPTKKPEVISNNANDKNANLVSLGEFKLTAYCSCEICCGKWALNRPKDDNGNDIVYGSTGTVLIDGMSIAVDPRVIPYGSEVVINGRTYVAHDTGGGIKGKRIDVYMSNHQVAREFGVQRTEVFIKK